MKVKHDEAAAGHARNLVRAFAILDAVAEHPDGATLSELATATGLSEATAHRLLGVLADLHAVRDSEDGRWRVGRRCLEMGAAYLDSVELRSEARPLMKGLTEDTGETCALGVLDGNRVVYVEKVDSPHPVRMHSGIGLSNPAASTSLGRAILAWSTDSVIERVLAHDIEARTDRTIIDPAGLRDELRHCEDRGYSIDDGENELGIRGVGAPVLDYRGRPVAALSVAGPQQRIPEERIHQLGAATASAAAHVSERLGFSPRVRDAMLGAKRH